MRLRVKAWVRGEVRLGLGLGGGAEDEGGRFVDVRVEVE